MKKTSKRLLCLLLTVLMLVSIAGCGNTAKDDGDKAGTTTTTDKKDDKADANIPSDPLGKYEEPVTLTSFFSIATVMQDEFKEEMVKNSYFNKRQEEMLNIFVDYQWYAPGTADDAEQKINMAIASGEIPDFMVVNEAQLAMLSKTDLINKDIGDIFMQYASEGLKDWFFADSMDAWDSVTYDGKTIALYAKGGAINDASILWMRKDWLDKLGLEVPKTMDDLYNVMMAFKTQDPDGNGVDDTYGMALNKDFMTCAGIAVGGGVMNSFGANPGIWVEDGNGGLTYGSVAEGAKDALSWMAQAYADGLIVEDFASMDGNQASENVVAGKTGIQYGANWNPMFPLNNCVTNDPSADWIAVPMPQKTEGVNPVPQCGTGIQYLYVVSAECEHPEAVVKLLNFYYEMYNNPEEYEKCCNDGVVDQVNGASGFPQHFVMLKLYDPRKEMKAHNALTKALETDNTEGMTPEEVNYYEQSKAYLENGDVNGFGAYRVYGPKDSAYDVIDYYNKNQMYVSDKFTTADTPTMTQKMSIVDDKILEFYTKVIMGIESVDNFDKFLEEVNALGLGDITSEVNEWYSSK